MLFNSLLNDFLATGTGKRIEKVLENKGLQLSIEVIADIASPNGEINHKDIKGFGPASQAKVEALYEDFLEASRKEREDEEKEKAIIIDKVKPEKREVHKIQETLGWVIPQIQNGKLSWQPSTMANHFRKNSLAMVTEYAMTGTPEDYLQFGLGIKHKGRLAKRVMAKEGDTLAKIAGEHFPEYSFRYEQDYTKYFVKLKSLNRLNGNRTLRVGSVIQLDDDEATSLVYQPGVVEHLGKWFRTPIAAQAYGSYVATTPASSVIECEVIAGYVGKWILAEKATKEMDIIFEAEKEMEGNLRKVAFVVPYAEGNHWMSKGLSRELQTNLIQFRVQHKATFAKFVNKVHDANERKATFANEILTGINSLTEILQLLKQKKMDEANNELIMLRQLNNPCLKAVPLVRILHGSMQMGMDLWEARNLITLFCAEMIIDNHEVLADDVSIEWQGNTSNHVMENNFLGKGIAMKHHGKDIHLSKLFGEYEKGILLDPREMKGTPDMKEKFKNHFQEELKTLLETLSIGSLGNIQTITAKMEGIGILGILNSYRQRDPKTSWGPQMLRWTIPWEEATDSSQKMFASLWEEASEYLLAEAERLNISLKEEGGKEFITLANILAMENEFRTELPDAEKFHNYLCDKIKREVSNKVLIDHYTEVYGEEEGVPKFLETTLGAWTYRNAQNAFLEDLRKGKLYNASWNVMVGADWHTIHELDEVEAVVNAPSFWPKDISLEGTHLACIGRYPSNTRENPCIVPISIRKGRNGSLYSKNLTTKKLVGDKDGDAANEIIWTPIHILKEITSKKARKQAIVWNLLILVHSLRKEEVDYLIEDMPIVEIAKTCASLLDEKGRIRKDLITFYVNPNQGAIGFEANSVDTALSTSLTKDLSDTQGMFLGIAQQGLIDLLKRLGLVPWNFSTEEYIEVEYHEDGKKTVTCNKAIQAELELAAAYKDGKPPLAHFIRVVNVLSSPGPNSEAWRINEIDTFDMKRMKSEKRKECHWLELLLPIIVKVELHTWAKNHSMSPSDTFTRAEIFGVIYPIHKDWVRVLREIDPASPSPRALSVWTSNLLGNPRGFVQSKTPWHKSIQDNVTFLRDLPEEDRLIAEMDPFIGVDPEVNAANAHWHFVKFIILNWYKDVKGIGIPFQDKVTDPSDEKEISSLMKKMVRLDLKIINNGNLNSRVMIPRFILNQRECSLIKEYFPLFLPFLMVSTRNKELTPLVCQILKIDPKYKKAIIGASFWENPHLPFGIQCEANQGENPIYSGFTVGFRRRISSILESDSSESQKTDRRVEETVSYRLTENGIWDGVKAKIENMYLCFSVNGANLCRIAETYLNKAKPTGKLVTETWWAITKLHAAEAVRLEDLKNTKNIGKIMHRHSLDRCPCCRRAFSQWLTKVRSPQIPKTIRNQGSWFELVRRAVAALEPSATILDSNTLPFFENSSFRDRFISIQKKIGEETPNKWSEDPNGFSEEVLRDALFELTVNGSNIEEWNKSMMNLDDEASISSDWDINNWEI